MLGTIIAYVKNYFDKFTTLMFSLLTFYQGLFTKLFDYFWPDYDSEKAQEKLNYAKGLGWEILKKLLIHFFVLIHCYMTGLAFYAVSYYFLVPKMNQEGALNFSKHKNYGYVSSFVNNINNNLCQPAFEKNLIELDDNFNLTRRQICQSNFRYMDDNLALHKEYYTIRIILSLPETEINYIRGSFSINTYMISAQGEIFKIPKIASMHHDKRRFILLSFWDRLLIFLGLQDDAKKMEVILENIPNHLLEIQALLVNIPDHDLIMLDSYIHIETRLFGIRYYLYHWFWITMMIAVNAIALTLFLLSTIAINLFPLIPSAKNQIITYLKDKNL